METMSKNGTVFVGVVAGLVSILSWGYVWFILAQLSW